MSDRKSAVQRFHEIIDSDKQLNKLYSHAKNITVINEKLHQYLSDYMDSSHYRVADYTDKTLTISADTSAWATKLRFRSADILNYVRQECGLSGLQTIRFRTLPENNEDSVV